ncbi:competence protein ComEA [Candidatus Hakubella thermalkaliphila]|uniref:Competence protein ComEA n=1 Tax=Candidatus Hakubella thermalkaliphila TaxID=2754717 RepID=A0A6V8Q3J7_9ACTN|nr:helix-hairpin-helix domain-containing protein [Candidatus Hakubella thermalkaliphila]GFP30299.1 competence protein ComEA [Candidatus Hakubella thermalkaliphila]GFP36349.1 competence protein ComEA [Candidatus Hakubella thermalkaliphila]GFP39352.1 competence protein ComEA [Candidatus Hakubella thermalkaliphila]GFP41838.1 competence protein ComEA [Candidatus Hakubella thermalkaliphila]
MSRLRELLSLIRDFSAAQWQLVVLALLALILTMTGIYFLYNSRSRQIYSVEIGGEIASQETEMSDKGGPREKGEEGGATDLVETQESREGQEEQDGGTVPVVVHVSGAVQRPGVYELREGMRVIDAIEMAGGGTEKSDIHQLNLAETLYDGQKIYVPAKGEEIGYLGSGSGGESSSGSATRKINLNTASIEELEELPGIGPTLATRIVEYREKHGPFRKVEQLMNVSGIGIKKFESLKDKVRI